MSKNLLKKIDLFSCFKMKSFIAVLSFICFIQYSFAEKNSDKSSNCSIMKMQGNIVIKANKATVFSDENNMTVILLPKSDKNNSITIESDSQKCI